MKAVFRLLVTLAVALAICAPNPAEATVINFDDLGSIVTPPDPNNPDSGYATIPNGYAGFNWDMFSVIHKDLLPGTGYQYGVVSGDYAAYNSWAWVATVSGETFVLRSAYFTSAWMDSLDITVTGYRNGEVVYTKTVTALLSGPTMFTFPTDKVDSVSFSSLMEFVMDDFTYSRIPVVDAGPNVQVTSENEDAIIIHGTAKDSDGEALVYRWVEGQNALTDWLDAGSNGEADLNLGPAPFVPVGDHTLTLQVKVRGTDIIESADMILTVSNTAPHATPSGAGAYEIAAPIAVGGEVSDYDGDLLTYTWSEGGSVLFRGTVATVAGGASVPIPDYTVRGLPLGSHVLTLQVNDGVNQPVSKDILVKVIDDRAPKLAPKADKSILWPPFHQMVPVTINANASDNGGGPVTLAVTVSSNEPHVRNECHEPANDWTTPVIDQAKGVITLKLRAERNPKGKGREYTIKITATDQSGNSSQALVKITVARAFPGDCDQWWGYWHNYNKKYWNEPWYKDWYDDWYSDWFRGWYR